MKLVRSGAIALAVLIGALLAMGFARTVGRRTGKVAGGALVQALSDRNIPSEWTPEYAEKVASMFRASKMRSMPGVITDQDAELMAACFREKYIASFPGGPREMIESSKRNDGTIGKHGASAGAECAKEFSAKVAASRTWVSQFTPLYVLGCVRSNGEAKRPLCECIATEAPKHFASPAAFMQVEGIVDTKKLSSTDRTRVRQLTEKCLAHFEREKT